MGKFVSGQVGWARENIAGRVKTCVKKVTEPMRKYAAFAYMNMRLLPPEVHIGDLCYHSGSKKQR